jgi:hypothetical protein
MFREFLWNWLPWIFNQATIVADISKRVALAAYTEATVSKEWAFLHNINVPISIQSFATIPVTLIRWKAKTNPPRFIEPNTIPNENDLKHLSYLGLSIIIPGHDTIELTDWLNDVKWSGALQPSLAEIFMLWCCDTGTAYFHLIPYATAEIVTDEGNIIRKGLNESTHTTSSNVSTSERQDSQRVVDLVFSSGGC